MRRNRNDVFPHNLPGFLELERRDGRSAIERSASRGSAGLDLRRRVNAWRWQRRRAQRAREIAELNRPSFKPPV
jgi:hypothetical protein